MVQCPFCDFENIAGADVCEECQQPLDDLSLPTPTTLLERSFLKDRIRTMDPKPALTVGPDVPVGQVLRMLVDRSVGCAVIVEGDQPVGIFSERDALMKLNVEAQSLRDRPVRDFMVPNPQTLQADAKIAFAVQRMNQGGFRHVPIVDADGRVTGVISVRDILRYITSKG